MCSRAWHILPAAAEANEHARRCPRYAQVVLVLASRGDSAPRHRPRLVAAFALDVSFRSSCGFSHRVQARALERAVAHVVEADARAVFAVVDDGGGAEDACAVRDARDALAE